MGEEHLLVASVTSGQQMSVAKMNDTYVLVAMIEIRDGFKGVLHLTVLNLN